MAGQIYIFLIEDDRDDIEFLKVALADNNVPFRMDAVIRGDLVMPWLQNAPEIPDIIIMDLNLPKVHGRDLLCMIRKMERFREVPLLVLTTSSLPEDQEYCLKNGASRYATKPTSIEGFAELADCVREMTAEKISK